MTQEMVEVANESVRMWSEGMDGHLDKGIYGWLYSARGDLCISALQEKTQVANPKDIEV